jgi:PAP2 superfamily
MVILSIYLLIAFAIPVLVLAGLVWWDPIHLRERRIVTGLGRRLARACEALIAEIGPVPTAVGTLLAGLAAIVVILWPLGKFAKLIERQVDVPVFEWIRARMSPSDPFTGFVAQLTKIGDLNTIYVIAGAAAVLFALLWRRRRWWFPPILLAVAVVAEVALQRILRLVVDRGHPPTALATYPSGGTARVIAVFGVIFFLCLLTWPGIRRPWRAIGWTVVGLLGAVEGFTRYYLLQHWITDVVAGWIFGELLLFVVLVSAWPITRLEMEAVARPGDRAVDDGPGLLANS